MPSGAYLLKFCIVGDAKEIFQRVDRSGFDSTCCIFCKFRPNEWKDKCSIRSGEHSGACVHKEKCTIEDINCVALEQFQKILTGEDHVSAGVRRHAFLPCTPASRILLTILHLLLGLVNYDHAHFKKFIAQKIEIMSSE